MAIFVRVETGFNLTVKHLHFVQQTSPALNYAVARQALQPKSNTEAGNNNSCSYLEWRQVAQRWYTLPEAGVETVTRRWTQK